MKAGTYIWDLALTGPEFSDSAKCISCNSNNYYSNSLSANGSAMHIGTFDFEITLAGGNTVTKQVVFPAPGKSTFEGYKYVYNEDYSGGINSDYTRMIRRSTPTIAVKKSDTILVSFTINDPLVYSGWIWFYDNNNNYLGRSDYFRNLTSKALSRIINQGFGLYNDGETNSVKILASDCVMMSGKNYSDITSLRVICCDGIQYSNTQSGYDYRSISKKMNLTLQ